MNEILLILIPIVLFIVNEYHQNKIFSFFERFYYYSKYIAIMIPFVLIYLKPEMMKKLMIIFKEIDNKPTYQNMDGLMSSYFDIKKDNMKNLRNNQYNGNNQYRGNNINNQNLGNNINNSYQGKMNNSNTIRHKRNVSESKKKYIASQQRWQCGHCNNLLDNTYEVDHIIPLYKGGSNELHNLTALCRNCHGVKTFKDKMGL